MLLHFPFSPLLTHCSYETGSAGEQERERKRERGGIAGKSVFVIFAYVIVGREECEECVV